MTQPAEAEVARLTPDEAAEAQFAEPHADIGFEPGDETEAQAAVRRFAHLFETSPGVFRSMMEGAKAGAETLSVDRLQGLAEIIQNADDAGARHVEFRVVDGLLVASHNGRQVRFRDVLGLATPWLTMKAEDVYATGKFGIGLMTLRALSDVLDVHSGPYHLRVGDPTITAIDSSNVPIDADMGATVFVVPVTRGSLDTDALEQWLNRWDDSALLFLRNVESISVLSPDGDVVRTLRLYWTDAPDSESVIGATLVTVARRHAHTTDDRSWLVHSVDVATPTGVHRSWKAAGDTVPLAVALPLHHDADGLASAGLPLVAMRTPVRVNAQFDPVANRRDLATNDWNDALLPLLADLWVQSVVDLFAEQSAAAWGVVPLPDGNADENRDGDSVIARLDALLLDRARTQLPERVTLTTPQGDHALSELAVEAPGLAGILTMEEIAQLADVPATLPLGARDDDERWRDVLSDWRSAGADLPDEVTVADALVLLEDEHISPEATVALTAAGLESDLAGTLARLRCIVLADSSHIVAPTEDSLHALVTSASPLAQKLGVGLLLHDAHVADRDDAQMVLEWLRERGALIDDADPQTVVRRLAAAGRAGHRVADVLTDAQVQALRDALETMNAEERSDLGPHIGAAITLDAFTFDSRGRRQETTARLVDSYLPSAIDKEPDSFAHAARSTPGLVWLHPRYATTLRSSLDRSAGLGAQKFLRLLGADLAPRLVPHAALHRRYQSEQSLGLDPNVRGSPPERRQEMASKGATYTLDDMDSPDLRAVATNIGAERLVTHRRKRAAALLGTLDRAWSRLQDHAYVVAADDNYAWQRKGETHAFWLWAVGGIAWLDDTDGVAQRPLDLRLRSAGTVAVHGQDAAGYLRPEFDTLSRREVLAALGVRGEPSTRDLVNRLIEVRALPDDDPVVAVDSALVYEALGEHIASRTSVAGDLSERELRTVFASHDGLVRTQLGWLPPTNVFAGKPIFGARRPFVPQVPNAERLWNLLQIRHPQVDDCRKVLLELARERFAPDGADRSVLLETLRTLDNRLAATTARSPRIPRRLATTPLWTTRGWTTERPVYAVSDPTLVDGLGLHVPVWLPDAELSQFAHLLDPLRIEVLSATATTVVDGDDADYDADATEVFRLAVPLLHDDLVRNDPKTAESLRTTWERFGEFEVRTDSELRVAVHDVALTNPITVSVSAKAGSDAGVLYLADPRLLHSVDAGGRAIASLFPATDPRQIAQAWLVACVGADEGRVAQLIASSQEVADEERERTREQMADRLATFQQGTAVRHADPARRRTTSAGRGSGSQPSPGGDGAQPAPPSSRPRVLVDPATLVVADPEGRPGGGSADGSARRRRRSPSGDGPLPDPDLSGRSPRSRTSAASYTPTDKETVGYECFLKVMASDRQEIVDLRGQHGVGADAVDTLDKNLYELKVHAQDEPETIRMTESEIRRAHSTPNFFLVIVSNVEGVNARPKVRVIVDPLEQLPMTPTSTVTLSGIRSAEFSHIYDLVPADDPD